MNVSDPLFQNGQLFEIVSIHEHKGGNGICLKIKTTYVICGSKFQIPTGSRDSEKDFPHSIWRRSREELKPRDEDVVIACGFSDELTSKIEAISTALTLLM